jgi:phosphatidylethanolamine-binding protein (PEBP) family uncharacterized protein
VVLSSLNNGIYFTTQQTRNKPRLVLDNLDNMNSSKLLMMYDPDAATPFIHWVTTLSGKDILPYYPPSPPQKTGIYRYILFNIFTTIY